jgi:hypothetical protein
MQGPTSKSDDFDAIFDKTLGWITVSRACDQRAANEVPPATFLGRSGSDVIMRTTGFAVAALASTVCVAPTLAADQKCDAQSMASVKAQIDALPEGDMKKMATDYGYELPPVWTGHLA